MKSRWLKNVSRVLRSKQTDAETLLWERLRDGRLQGVKFRRQLPLVGYIVDFCSIQNGLVIELDGGQHAQKVEEDQQRTERLKEGGYRVIRFWDNDILKNTESVLEKIQQELRKG